MPKAKTRKRRCKICKVVSARRPARRSPEDVRPRMSKGTSPQALRRIQQEKPQVGQSRLFAEKARRGGPGARVAPGRKKPLEARREQNRPRSAEGRHRRRDRISSSGRARIRNRANPSTDGRRAGERTVAPFRSSGRRIAFSRRIMETTLRIYRRYRRTRRKGFSRRNIDATH